MSVGAVQRSEHTARVKNPLEEQSAELRVLDRLFEAFARVAVKGKTLPEVYDGPALPYGRLYALPAGKPVLNGAPGTVGWIDPHSKRFFVEATYATDRFDRRGEFDTIGYDKRSVIYDLGELPEFEPHIAQALGMAKGRWFEPSPERVS